MSIARFKDVGELKKSKKIIELIGRRYKMQREIEKTIKSLIGSSIIIYIIIQKFLKANIEKYV